MDQRGMVVTKNVYFSLLTHTNQLLLVTLCHTPAGIGNSKVGRDAVRTDRRECRNSYVDRLFRFGLCSQERPRGIGIQ